MEPLEEEGLAFWLLLVGISMPARPVAPRCEWRWIAIVCGCHPDWLLGLIWLLARVASKRRMRECLADRTRKHAGWIATLSVCTIAETGARGGLCCCLALRHTTNALHAPISLDPASRAF